MNHIEHDIRHRYPPTAAGRPPTGLSGHFAAEENAALRRDIFLSGGNTGTGDLRQTYFNYPNAWKLSWRHIGEFDRAGPMKIPRTWSKLTVVPLRRYGMSHIVGIRRMRPFFLPQSLKAFELSVRISDVRIGTIKLKGPIKLTLHPVRSVQ